MRFSYFSESLVSGMSWLGTFLERAFNIFSISSGANDFCKISQYSFMFSFYASSRVKDKLAYGPSVTD